MGWLTKAAAIAAMAMLSAGCGDSSGDDSGDAQDHDHAAGAGVEHHAADSSQAIDDVALPSATANSDVELTQETAEGTMALFIDCMQSGRFEEALLLVDPESLGYPEMEVAVSALNSSEGKVDSSDISLEPMLKAMWSRPWVGATFEAVTVRDDRARFEYKLTDHDPKVVDLTNVGGEWYLIAPEKILEMDIPYDMIPNRPAPAPGAEADGAPQAE